MIKQETINLNGRLLVRTYSDAGKKIIQEETGWTYGEAVDPLDMHRTYTESTEDIERPEDEEGIDNERDISADEVLAALEEIV